MNALEPRTLSSAQTLWAKLFAAAWIAGFGLAVLALWTNVMTVHGEPAGAGAKRQLLAVWMFGSLMMYRYSLTLKRVRLSGRTLHISNYLKEIRVSADEIADVTENMWINYHPITIHFRSPTEFGDEITFMPTLRWSGFWRAHPAGDELRKAAAGEGAE